MAENKLGLFPHHRALVEDSPNLQFLYGARDSRKQKAQKSSEGCCINEITFTDDIQENLLKYGLHVPLSGYGQKVTFLNEKEKRVLAEKLAKLDSPIQEKNRMIIAREGEEKSSTGEEDKILELKQRIMQDYKDTVLRTTLFLDPPERGQYGYAYMPLKEGAVPVRQKPFFMHGERKEALEKVTQDWIDKKFIEPATSKNSEWLSQTFPVPKKNPVLFLGGGS